MGNLHSSNGKARATLSLDHRIDISDMNSLGEGFIREMANRRAEPVARSMEYMWIYMSFFTLPASQAIPAAGWLSKGLTTTLCFVAGTPVMTDEWLKVIEEIQTGDEIASWLN